MSAMTGIRVSIARPTAEGRLYPAYDNAIGILTLASDTPRPCPFGVTIDGAVILDFDAAGVLAGVELLLPMRRWKGKADVREPGGAAGDVVLPAPRIASSSYDWAVTVGHDVQSDAARIDFAPVGYDRAVRLSEACCALLLGDALTGFWFSLRR
ncbi:MAG TPA: hypothetical protein VGB79_07985 [Allosphingosinicella sp.]